MLQSDKGVAALPGGSLNFERWIKHGLSPEDLVNSSNDSGELLSQAAPSPSPGTHLDGEVDITACSCFCNFQGLLHHVVVSGQC